MFQKLLSTLERLSVIILGTAPSISRPMEDDEADLKRVQNWCFWAIGVCAVFALIAQGPTGLWWGFAALASGAFAGFLFGIPRVVQADLRKTDDPEFANYSQRVNTNLEQISDWLTKIIVGFGLIELRQIPSAFQSLATFVAKNSDSNAAIAGSVLISFAVIGFFAGYLLTRLYLAAAFGRADAKSNHFQRPTYEQINATSQSGHQKAMYYNPGAIQQIESSGVTPQTAEPPLKSSDEELRNVLVVVDVQNDFFDGGSLPVPDAESLIDPLNRAIEMAEAAKFLIVFTQDWHPTDHSSFQANGGDWLPHCIMETSGAALHRSLTRPSNSVTVKFGIAPEKDGYSPFENPLMDELINSPNIGKIYVTGIALEYCVLATCRDAKGRNKPVAAVKELIRAASPQNAEKIWRKLTSMGVETPNQFDFGASDKPR